MHKSYTRSIGVLFLCMLLQTAAYSQKSMGIGTTTPDSNAVLDIRSTTAGVLIPTLTTAQQSILSGILNSTEMGMLVADATTGKPVYWGGSAWQAFTPGNTLSAQAPISINTNNIQLNPGTQAGDLITWDGTNWVNMQPAIQHFSFTVDNHQPYQAINFCISLYGIFPTQNDASQPYVGEIIMMGANFAPVGWQFCDGTLLSIAEYTVLFDLIGTTYGGDGISTFAVPDLRGRVPIHMGSNGTTTYILGQQAGSENKTFSH